jgi:hypothetical protein
VRSPDRQATKGQIVVPIVMNIVLIIHTLALSRGRTWPEYHRDQAKLARQNAQQKAKQNVQQNVQALEPQSCRKCRNGGVLKNDLILSLVRMEHTRGRNK